MEREGIRSGHRVKDTGNSVGEHRFNLIKKGGYYGIKRLLGFAETGGVVM